MVVLIAAMAAASAMMLPSMDASTTCEEEGPAYIQTGIDVDHKDIPGLVADFERMSHLTEKFKDEGKDARFILDRSEHGDSDRDRFIDHMVDKIGKEHFSNSPHDESNRPELPPDDRFPRLEVPPELFIESTADDLGKTNAEFVLDVIEFALNNGMEDIAMELSSTLSDNLEALFHTVNYINSADTRSSTLDEQEDDDGIIIITEEEESEDTPPFADENILPIAKAPSPVLANPFANPILEL